MFVHISVKRSKGFLESLFESPADCHYFAGTFHSGCQSPVSPLKFVEGPAGNFYDYIIYCRFKGGWCTTRHTVHYLIKPEAYGYFCCNPCDRVSSRLRCECR